jgi:hypothetical protein
MKSKEKNYLDGEEWKEIEGFGGKYSVSNLGRIRKNDTGLLLKANRTIRGNSIVTLRFAGLNKTKTVSSLVAAAFLERPEGACRVEFIDGDNANNRADNLVYVMRNGIFNKNKKSSRPDYVAQKIAKWMSTLRIVRDSAAELGSKYTYYAEPEEMRRELRKLDRLISALDIVDND